MDTTTISIVIAILIVIVAGVIAALSVKKTAKKDKVLLVGCKSAGKTCLYLRLIHKLYGKKTVTSIEANEAQLDLGDDRSVRIVDIPGHPRLAENVLQSHTKEAQAIVYVIDSASFNKEVRPVAELLFNVLVRPELQDTPVLVVCNKQDIVTAAKSSSIVRKLEKELTQLRQTASTSVGDTAGEDTTPTIELGDMEADEFKFEQLSARVDFEQCMLKDESSKAMESDKLILNWILDVTSA
eukprot:TRINITY_DN24153_c0_g1_i1.p1 TRINITY_DN24153_c0_g1~~TRINITY_DN24153_c0_g1_i1.p1  ORF type:complete len:252 (+),score=69.96 TRINITY_DN24153_c0_g1_i1:39-758(+)